MLFAVSMLAGWLAMKLERDHVETALSGLWEVVCDAMSDPVRVRGVKILVSLGIEYR